MKLSEKYHSCVKFYFFFHSIVFGLHIKHYNMFHQLWKCLQLFPHYFLFFFSSYSLVVNCKKSNERTRKRITAIDAAASVSVWFLSFHNQRVCPNVIGCIFHAGFLLSISILHIHSEHDLRQCSNSHRCEWSTSSNYFDGFCSQVMWTYAEPVPTRKLPTWHKAFHFIGFAVTQIGIAAKQ